MAASGTTRRTARGYSISAPAGTPGSSATTAVGNAGTCGARAAAANAALFSKNLPGDSEGTSAR
jgi:hypothetical protein